MSRRITENDPWINGYRKGLFGIESPKRSFHAGYAELCDHASCELFRRGVAAGQRSGRKEKAAA